MDHSKYDIFSNLIFLFQNNAFIIHLVICGHTQVCYMQEKCKWTFRIRNLSSVNKSDSDQIPLLEKLFMKRNGRIQILILEKPVRDKTTHCCVSSAQIAWNGHLTCLFLKVMAIMQIFILRGNIEKNCEWLGIFLLNRLFTARINM